MSRQPSALDIQLIEYEIQQIAQEQHIDPRITISSRDNRIILGATIHFIKSKQHVVKTDKEFVSGKEIKVLLSGTLNYFRAMVTSFEPSLNFGWLSPKYRFVTQIVEKHNHYDCYNIQPITQREARACHGRKYAYHTATAPEVWLEDVPPNSPEDLKNNLAESHEEDYIRQNNPHYHQGFYLSDRERRPDSFKSNFRDFSQSIPPTSNPLDYGFGINRTHKKSPLDYGND